MRNRETKHPHAQPLTVEKLIAVSAVAIKKTCNELLNGNDPALDKSRQIPIVQLYRKRKVNNDLDSFTLTETVELARVCLEVTENSGKLLDPDAHQVVPPNWIATITTDRGFEWTLKAR